MLYGTETLEQAKANRPLTWNTGWTADKVQVELDYLLKLQEGFLAGLIPPRKVVGGGYKNARKVATQWLVETITEKRAMLAELESVA